MMRQFFLPNMVCIFLTVYKRYNYLRSVHYVYIFIVTANEFPVGFEIVVRKILRLLFHVLAHLYHSHFRELVLLNLHSHLNCVFAHLSVFNNRYQLIELRETEILQDLVVALKILGNEEETAANSNESTDEYKGVINNEPTMSYADPINMFRNPSPTNTQILATQVDNF